MPSAIEGPGSTFLMSTRRLFALLDLGLQVGRAAAVNDDQHGYVNTLWTWRNSAATDAPFNLEERFPAIAAKKFWATTFRNVARRIFLRQLGDQTVTHWQSTAIADAVTIGRLLTECVRAVEEEWYPETEDDRELAEKSVPKL